MTEKTISKMYIVSAILRRAEHLYQKKYAHKDTLSMIRRWEKVQLLHNNLEQSIIKQHMYTAIH